MGPVNGARWVRAAIWPVSAGSTTRAVRTGGRASVVGVIRPPYTDRLRPRRMRPCASDNSMNRLVARTSNGPSPLRLSDGLEQGGIDLHAQGPPQRLHLQDQPAGVRQPMFDNPLEVLEPPAADAH